MQKRRYNPDQFPFAEVLKQELNIYSLARIHENLPEKYGVFNKDTDQDSIFHKKFYELVEDPNHDFLKCYRRFVEMVIAPIFSSSNLLYQTKPTIRFHYPHNLSVGEYHRDRDYNHNTKEVNFFVPLTKAYGANTIWCEENEGDQDYRALNAEFDEFWQFDGANLEHGNKLNDTGFTRVSFDFRVLREEDYKEEDLVSVTRGVGFKIGEYWSVLD